MAEPSFIPFTTIPRSGLIRTNTHNIEFDASRAVQAGSRPHKILMMGIQLSSATAPALSLRRFFSGAQAEGYWGVGSQVGDMGRYGKNANGLTEMWGIGIAELGGGTAGIRTMTITGTATATRTMHHYVGGEFYVPVAITEGDLQNAIATKVHAAITGHGQYSRMPFTVTVGTNVVTFTMKWKGVDVADARNNYNNGEVDVPGVGVAFALATPGAGNPDISAIISAIAAQQFDTIICPWNDATNLGLLKTEMTRRWGGMVQKEGHVFLGHVGNLGAASSLGNAHNHPNFTIMPANLSPTSSWLWAAVAGSVDAMEPLPSRPRQTLALTGCLPCAPELVWTDEERNSLLFDGCSTHVVGEDRGVTFETVITTYKANSQGIEDESYLYIETVRTLAAIRYDLRASTSLKYPRHLLQSDGEEPPLGMPVLTPKRYAGHCKSRFEEWVKSGWVESSSRKQFFRDLLVIRPGDSRCRLEGDLAPDLMNQFRGFSGKIGFIA